jgi:hypothetical protein
MLTKGDITMIEAIKAYQEDQAREVNQTQLVTSDDGTIVIFRKNYDSSTGERLGDEVVKAITPKDIDAEIVKRQAEIATLQAFLASTK